MSVFLLLTLEAFETASAAGYLALYERLPEAADLCDETDLVSWATLPILCAEPERFD